MKRPLIIFWGYQEIHNASGQIARTFWEHMPESEFAPTILCAKLDSSFKSKKQIVPVKENRLLRLLFRLLRRVGLTDLTMIPDIEFYAWNYRAYRKAKKLLMTGDYDYIHTIATPMSSHVLGVKLKKEFGLPLIIQCNDPWHDNSKRIYKYQWCSRRDLYYEGQVARYADVIIQSNEVITDIWKERYGEIIEKKIHIVPFSFNIYNLPKVVACNRNPNKKIVISHIGNIYSSRSSLTLFQGIEQLLKCYPEYREKIVLRFIGSVHQSEKEYVASHNLDYIVEYTGCVNPDDLYSYYLDSDFFLILDVIIKRNGNYPSKLMMYYYYQKPILALTTPQSNLEKELLASGHTVCYYDEPETVCEFLIKAINDYDSFLKFNKNEWKKHTVEHVKNIYITILSKIGIE